MGFKKNMAILTVVSTISTGLIVPQVKAVDLLTAPMQLIFGCDLQDGYYTHAFCLTASTAHESLIASALLLPFTILNEEGQLESIEELKLNGFSDEEIQDIISDVVMVENASKELKIKTREEAKKLLESINLNPATIEYFGL